MYLYPFLAVIIGSVIVLFLSKKAIQINSQLTLAFSGAFLLSITVFDLLPSLYTENIFNNKSDQKLIGLMIMTGVLFQVILEFFSNAKYDELDTNKNKLPWVLLISLSIHAFIEGFSITPSIIKFLLFIFFLILYIPHLETVFFLTTIEAITDALYF